MDFGVSYSPTHYTASPTLVAVEAEALGSESLFMPEHSHMPLATDFPLDPETPMIYKSMFDPFISLAAAAAVTETIKLGTSIALSPSETPSTARRRSPRWTRFQTAASYSASARAGITRRWRRTALTPVPGSA